MKSFPKTGYLLVVATAALVAMNLVAATDTQRPDKTVASKKFTGRILSYQEGDYAHLSMKTDKGSELSFFVDDEICFLAHNQGVLTIEYHEIERFFPEGGGYFPANIIQSIVTKDGEKRWLRSASAKSTLAEQNECARVLRAAFVR